MPDGDDLGRELSRGLHGDLSLFGAGRPAPDLLPVARPTLVARMQHVVLAALMIALVLALAGPALAKKREPQPVAPVVVAPPTPA
uniref:hypothetical protein n=1 Tax=Sandarakinorhabdus rubra TaxID=2672568 RepID=UPI0013DC54E0